MAVKPSNLHAPRLFIAALVVFSNFLYFLVFNVLGYDFIQLLFTIFGIVIACGPAILTALFLPELAKKGLIRIFSILSVYAGCVTNLVTSYFAAPQSVPYGAPLSVLVATILIITGFVASRIHDSARTSLSGRPQ
jgi:hypothetical protein